MSAAPATKSLILGHRGMVGSALLRAMPDAAVLKDRRVWDLTDAHAVNIIFNQAMKDNVIPDVVYLCAALVGGIGRNLTEPGRMIYENLAIQTNVINAACHAGVKLFVFLGSSCLYPVSALEPLCPSALMTGPLEPSHEAYAVAKIAGIKMLEAYHRQYGMEFLVLMPCNLYGPNDNFRPGESHLMASLIRRFQEAMTNNLPGVKLWGNGVPRREFLHVDDFASAVQLLVSQGARGIVNVGSGFHLSVREWAAMVADLSGYDGTVTFDGDTLRNGVQSKLMRTEPIDGWKPRSAARGVSEAIQWYWNNCEAEGTRK